MKRFLLLIASSLFLSNCSYFQSTPPQHGSLTRNLELVDGNGTRYGHVELEPLGGGKLIDADGKMIARLVPPDSPPCDSPAAPTPQQ